MAATSRRERSPEEVRREIDAERRRLAEAVETLRGEIGSAADVKSKLRAKLPLAAAGAAGLGFVASGGIGATVRLLLRRRREGETTARAGRFEIVRRS
jgi:hypothetical protein